MVLLSYQGRLDSEKIVFLRISFRISCDFKRKILISKIIGSFILYHLNTTRPNTSTPKAYTEVGKIAIANGYPRDNAGVTQVMIVVKSDKSNALCSASKKRKKRGISLGGSEIAIPQAILADIMADPTM